MKRSECFGGWLRDPVRLSDQHQATRPHRRPQQLDRPAESAADPGGPDAGDDVIGRCFGAVRTGLALLEPHQTGDIELRCPRSRRREEDVAQVNADAFDTEALSPATEHLPFPTRQIELPLASFEAAALP